MPGTLARDGVRLAFEARGKEPPDALFMHGWAGSGSYFDQVIERLDLDRLRTITYDFRGHGSSDATDEGHSLDMYASDALAVADAAGADRFVAVGFSMSGKFAQYLAGVAADRLHGLVIIAGLPAGTFPIPSEVLAAMMSAAGDRERFRAGLSPWLTRPVDTAAFERCCEQAERVSLTTLERSLPACTDTAFTEEAGQIHVPTLVVAGARDSLTTLEMTRVEIVGILPSARLAVLDCGHEIPLEAPVETAALIEAFLAGLAVGRR